MDRPDPPESPSTADRSWWWDGQAWRPMNGAAGERPEDTTGSHSPSRVYWLVGGVVCGVLTVLLALLLYALGAGAPEYPGQSVESPLPLTAMFLVLFTATATSLWMARATPMRGSSRRRGSQGLDLPAQDRRPADPAG